MDDFLVSSEDCKVLKTFKDAKSLREAARILGIDPTGLTRKVQSISNKYSLIQKVNNRWQLTSQGLNLVAWTEASIQEQKRVLKNESSLRISTTPWFAEEILFPNFSQIQFNFQEKTKFHFLTPRNDLELELIHGNTDFLIHCQPPKAPEINHKKIFKEEWIVIAPIKWKGKISNKKDLQSYGLVRHLGINIDTFIPEISELPPKVAVYTDNLTGVRSAVINGLGWSIVPKLLVSTSLKEKSIFQVPYDINIKDRNFYLSWLRDRYFKKGLTKNMVSSLRKICQPL